MSNGVLIECVCTHAVLGAEKMKIFTGNKPVKRATLATNRTIALHKLLQIPFGFESNLPAVATTLIFHWTVPFDDFISDFWYSRPPRLFDAQAGIPERNRQNRMNRSIKPFMYQLRSWHARRA